MKITDYKNLPTGVVLEILHELERAEQKHPVFPSEIVQQVAIMAEEAGEAIREANRVCWNEGGTLDALRTELIQTAAMCLRCIKNMGDGK